LRGSHRPGVRVDRPLRRSTRWLGQSVPPRHVLRLGCTPTSGGRGTARVDQVPVLLGLGPVALDRGFLRLVLLLIHQVASSLNVAARTANSSLNPRASSASNPSILEEPAWEAVCTCKVATSKTRSSHPWVWSTV